MQDSKLRHTGKPSSGKPPVFGKPHYCVTYHTIFPLTIYFGGVQQFDRNVVWTSQPLLASSV